MTIFELLQSRGHHRQEGKLTYREDDDRIRDARVYRFDHPKLGRIEAQLDMVELEMSPVMLRLETERAIEFLRHGVIDAEFKSVPCKHKVL